MGLRILCLRLAMATGRYLSNPRISRPLAFLNTNRRLLMGGRLSLLNTIRHPLTGGHRLNTVRLRALLNTVRRPALPNTVPRPVLKGHWLSLLNTGNLLALPNTGSLLAISTRHHVPKSRRLRSYGI